MTVKEKIINTLKETGVDHIDKMLQYMEDHGFYTCKGHSHNKWTGGTSQHVWAVYLIAKALRDQNKDNPLYAKYATDEKLALVCLLHDICDMKVKVRNRNGENVEGHGRKSYWIMKNLNVGTEVERIVVRNHMHREVVYPTDNQQEKDEYNVLHDLITDADHKAAGIAWNFTRFKDGRTQHQGEYTNDKGYLRAVAMDRTVQSSKSHLYMDAHYELREYHKYNEKQIIWNGGADIISKLHDDSNKIKFDQSSDVITEAHNHYLKTGKKLCLVVGVSGVIPKDQTTRLRQDWKDEQSILICSNLLRTFYKGRESEEEKKKKKYRFEFTMRDSIKDHYRALHAQEGGIYMPDVTMIRDGESRGYPFVEPWLVDILFVPGRHFPMYAILS